MLYNVLSSRSVGDNILMTPWSIPKGAGKRNPTLQKPSNKTQSGGSHQKGSTKSTSTNPDVAPCSFCMHLSRTNQPNRSSLTGGWSLVELSNTLIVHLSQTASWVAFHPLSTSWHRVNICWMSAPGHYSSHHRQSLKKYHLYY